MKHSHLLSAIAALLAPCVLFADYAKEFDIQFAGYAGSTTLTNFPALIRLSKARNSFDYSKCILADGADVRFFDANGNLLPSEVDTWNPQGESLVWVSVPELNRHTVITVRYGSADVPAVTPADVWTNGYVGVWHMSAAALTDKQKDSTVNGNNLETSPSNQNGMQCGVDGAVGLAAELGRDGVKKGGYSVLDSANVLDGFSNITLEVWTYQTSYDTVARYLFNKQDPNVNKSAYYFQQRGGSEGRIAAYIKKNRNGSEGDAGVWQGNTYPGAQLNEWTHQVFRWSGETGRTSGFLNGVNVNELGANGSRTGVGIQVGGRFYVGNYFPNQEKVFPGKIDEVRVSNVARSDDWVVATYDTIANDEFAVSEVPNDWTRYAHKFSVAFPGIAEGVTLENFPVLVKVSEANIPGFQYADCVKEGGADLRFTDGNSTTPLPSEVEVWDTNGTSLIWVKVPTLTKDTRITGYYGWNLAPAVFGTDVWDEHYVAVWHMDAAEGSFTQKDSTMTRTNVIAPDDHRAGILCGVDGVVGAAAELGRDGVTTDCFYATDGGTALDGFPGITLEAWTFQTNYPSADAFLISKMAPSPWSVPYRLYQRKNSGQLTGILYTSANGYCDVWPASGANPQLNEWAYQSFRWDGSTGIRTGFINGTSVAEKSTGSNVSGVGLHNANAPLTIGNEHYSKSTVFPGKIDEVRISNVVRSDAWVKATYDTIADNATFTRYSAAHLNAATTVIFFK